MKHAKSLVVLSCLVLGLAAGCGDNSSSGSGGYGGSPKTGGQAKTVDVAMTSDNAFVPATVTINAGDTVRWTNNDPATKHTATRKAAPAFDSGLLPPKGTFSFTFPTASGPAGYDYVCTPHAAMGMKGVVIVK